MKAKVEATNRLRPDINMHVTFVPWYDRVGLVQYDR